MTKQDVITALEGFPDNEPIAFDIKSGANLQYFVEEARWYTYKGEPDESILDRITLSLKIS